MNQFFIFFNPKSSEMFLSFLVYFKWQYLKSSFLIWSQFFRASGGKTMSCLRIIVVISRFKDSIGRAMATELFALWILSMQYSIWWQAAPVCDWRLAAISCRILESNWTNSDLRNSIVSDFSWAKRNISTPPFAIV